MKKLILILIPLLFFTACQKDKIIDNTTSKVGDFHSHKLDATAIIQNEEDPIDVEFKKGLLSLADVMKDVLTDENIRTYLVSEAKSNKKGFVTFNKLFEEYPNLKREINLLLKNSAIAKELNIEDYDNYVNTMTHTDVKYIPVINIPNHKNDLNQANYFISPGIEVEDNDELKIDDNIFSWYIQDGLKSEISISKKQAFDEKNPLFVIAPHMENEDNLPNVPSNVINNTETANKASASKTWRIKKFKINMRYESSGRSELRICGAEVSGSNGYVRGIYGAHNVYSTLLASVHPSKIGKYQYSNQFFCDNQYSGVVSYNLYEEDWWATAKRITYLAYPGGNWTSGWLNGKRTYWHEWYLFSGSSNPTNRAHNVNSSSTSVTKSSYKAYLNFKR